MSVSSPSRDGVRAKVSCPLQLRINPTYLTREARSPGKVGNFPSATPPDLWGVS